eukprot:GHVN01089046.1.p1 GENE.GHVN01089046.1~~GHVN01089046.1.p1  ORF type:complete len:314 (-),score=12.84 GHVN01089046.1:376-1317(-)
MMRCLLMYSENVNLCLKLMEMYGLLTELSNLYCAMPLINFNKKIVGDPQQIAVAFANHYKMMFTPITPCLEDLTILPVPSLTHIPFLAPASVIKLIACLKSKTGSGPGCIPVYVIRRLAKVLADPLAHFYNESIATCYVPTEWKCSNVTPIYKNKGLRSLLVSYRPNSMCNALSLVVERHVYDILYLHLERTSQLNIQQHGCRWGVSTVTNLLLALDMAFRHRDLHLSFCSVFLDFAKAFDKIDHTHLIYKLRKYGVGGDILMWTVSWLIDHDQRVKIGGGVSAWYQLHPLFHKGLCLDPCCLSFMSLIFVLV